MQFTARQLRSYTDQRLMNVVVFRERYGYPFDYVEACKDELRRRGYTQEELLSVITARAAEGGPDMPQRLALRESIAARAKAMALLGGTAVVLFGILILWGDAWSAAARKTVGGAAVGCLCVVFLLYAYRTILQGRLARLDSDDDPPSFS